MLSRRAIIEAQKVTDRPSMIACKTIIGFGFPTKAGTQKAHSDAPGEEEIAGARKLLDWSSPPFEIPAELLEALAVDRLKGAEATAWHGQFACRTPAVKSDPTSSVA
jgi:transketolase